MEMKSVVWKRAAPKRYTGSVNGMVVFDIGPSLLRQTGYGLTSLLPECYLDGVGYYKGSDSKKRLMDLAEEKLRLWKEQHSVEFKIEKA